MYREGKPLLARQDETEASVTLRPWDGDAWL